MIARKEWFQRRKYGGWGVNPKTWQGWVYIAAILLLLAVFQALPFWSTQTRIIITIAWAVLLFIDIVPVMINLNRDEREHKIEALSERNAAWVMSLILVIGVFYELLTSSLNQEPSVNVFLVAALLGGVLTKSLSNYKLGRKEL